jgi:polysaccharide export outer membrane protein
LVEVHDCVRRRPRSRRTAVGIAGAVSLAQLMVGGCVHQLPQGGPSTAEIVKSSTSKRPSADYVVIDLNSRVAAGLLRTDSSSLIGAFGDAPEDSVNVIKAGDYVTVTFWEAGTTISLLGQGSSSDAGGGAGVSTLHETVPEQVVSQSGTIAVPFAGRVQIAGMTPEQADGTVRAALHGIAANPQVLVSISRNTSNQAVVIGDDVKGMSYPLTPNANRVLDALAAAGGIASPIYQAQVRLSRDGRYVTMGLDRLLATPAENIRLHPHDVLSVLKNPKFFTVLGALGHNAQIQFQNDNMSLAQALGDAAGLIDERADPSGGFLFRFEPKTQVQALCPSCNTDRLGPVVPVIYRLNMRHADAFFVARTVQMQDRDVMFVSNAPEVQMAKIFSTLRDAFSPVLAAGVIARDAQN